MVDGSHALVGGAAAEVLLRRFLAGWQRSGLSHAEHAVVVEAVQALRAAAIRHRSISDLGRTEGHRKARSVDSEAWLSTRDVANSTAKTPRRILQMQAEHDLGGRKFGGRWWFPASASDRVRALVSHPDD